MKRLLLLGGGHAHLRVLAELARRPLAGWEICLVTPHSRQIYSGMLPGWIAGHYALDDCSIDLRPLAARASTDMRLDEAAALDADRRVLRTARGDEISYDVLSIDVGSVPNIGALHGASQHGILIRPIEGFVQQWPPLVARLRARCTRFDVAVLGGGAAGVELAFALRHRGMSEGWSHLRVHLVGAEETPLPSLPPQAGKMALELLRQKCISWHGERRAVEVAAMGIRFDDDSELHADACWVITGAAAHPWLGTTRLALDEAGFVRVDSALRSTSHPGVFAAGDVASHPRPLPKAGVHAVRAGRLLARNVLAFCRGSPMAEWHPRTRALYLISTGDRRALAIWGDWVWKGRWVWRWKDAIDRRFVGAYAP